jgi:hypothetical protein
LACHTCPIYLATWQENKEEQRRMRVEIAQRGRAATKQEKGLGDIKMLWQDDGGKMI